MAVNSNTNEYNLQRLYEQIASMARAGRVAIVPKGEYNLQRLYERLDMVRYQNRVYIAKKSSTGILPTNEEYWMLALTNDGSSQELIMFLAAEETRLEFAFDEIKQDSTITVQTNNPTVNYRDIQVNGNIVTVIFEPQATGIYVKVIVSEQPTNSYSYTVTETKILAIGATEIAFTVDNLSSNSVISIQTDNPKAYYRQLTVSGNTLTVFFDEQTVETKVRAVISNEL